MKPKRYHFRGTPLFGATLRYGAPVLTGFVVFVTGLNADARDILRSSSGGGAASPATATTAGSSTPAATDVARTNTRDILLRTNQTLDAMRALQAAARAAAANGGNNLGPNLPNVANGLAPGGLQVAPGAGTDPTKWAGATLPTQTISGDKTTVTIKQTTQQALLNWQTFNVGKKTTVTFDQSAGGENAAQWIAFNKISDPTGNPTQILGSIKAEGQVYLINRNGIIFGGSSQVNARGLTVSSLPINDNLINRGLLNNPDAQFLFSGLSMPAGSNGTPAFTPELPVTANGQYGDVVVQKGAVLTSPTNSAKVGGRITLVGPNVLNEGTISTPDGQTILASGLQVGFDAHSSSDPSLRGLDVFVGQVGGYAGTTTNSGLIDSPRGSITIAGREVNQLGMLDSTTSVSLNGRIDIQAQYNAISNRASASAKGDLFLFQDTGTVGFGEDSVIRILPESGSKETTIGTELALRSQVNVVGKAIHLGENSTLLATNGKVNFAAGIWNFAGGLAPASVFAQSGGQVYLENGVLVDVSGSIAVPVPVSQNIVTVQLRGAELAGSPLQRDGVLRNETVSVDIRDAGIYQQEMWVGTPLANISGFANLIQKGVGQLTVAGGTVNISAGDSVVMQAGSKIDVSGGSIEYTGGAVQTTQLLSNGHLVDISKALPNEVYDGIYDGTTTVSNPKWGVTNTYKNPLAPNGYRYEESSTSGGAGGSLAITAPSMALDGSLVGKTFNGGLQRTAPPASSSIRLSFLAQDLTYPALPFHAPAPPDIVFRAGVFQSAADAFALDSNGSPLALRADRKEDVWLSPELLTDGGFGSLAIENNDGNITVPAGVDLSGQAGGSIIFKASNITVDGSVSAAGGSLSYSTFSLSLDTVNLIQNSTAAAAPPLAAAGSGQFTLGSGGRLSTAGMIVDDRAGSDSNGISPISLKGGTVKIEGYSAHLSAGGLIDVSGGAMASANGAIIYGNGGSLTVAAGREIGFSATLGGKLLLGATLQGFSGAKAGSLALTAPAFQIGGASANPGVTLLQPEFFSQGGFGGVSLTGIGLATPVAGEYVRGVYIADGTRIQPLVKSYFANLSGENLRMDSITREEGIRSPISLSFGAVGASYNGVPLVQGNVVMGEGASIEIDGTITTDATVATAGKGSVSFSGQTVTILGSVVAPGGSITVAGRNQFPADISIPPVSALPTAHLGSAAFLSTAGKTVLVDNPFGLRKGQVISGGTITVSGNIIAESGAVLDVSGASGVLDLSPTFTAFDTLPEGAKTVPVRIDSNGGTITLAGSEMLFTDATLIGKAGGTSATGGSLAVGSGRFIADASPFTTADVNLVVSQNGTALPASGSGLGVGRLVLDAAGNPAAQLGHFSVARYATGGFDSLALNGNIRFDGPVSIDAPGSLRIASGGVIYADSGVLLSARHVALGQAFRAPTQQTSEQLFSKGVMGVSGVFNFLLSPTHGDGTLTVKADLIDIGDLSLQGIGTAAFLAPAGDVRGNGTLHIAGDLFFEAGQIYPTTGRAFNIFAYDHGAGGLNQPGSVTITGGTARALPLSAGGTLSIHASEINQGGTLRAPIGTINLGWDGTGIAPLDPIAGAPTAANPFQRPITSQLVLESGSVTSVSAIDPVTGKGILIPYGISLDGSSWIDPAGNDITISGAPAKAIHLSAGSVVSESGSTLDIRGGGDLYAFRWVSGNGGKNDVLASSSNFAVIPGYGFDYAPYAPFNPDSTATALGGQPGYVNSSLKVGDTVTLGASAGLPAGTYTLLPARYALLPGAFLVTPQGGAPVGTVSRPDGSALVSGYRSNDLDPAREGVTLMSRFEIAGSKVVRARAEYQDLLANTVLRDAAIAREFAVPRLPGDSGYLAFSSTASLLLAGQVESLALASGRGGLIDISSPGNILINNTGTGGGAGDLVLQSSLLNSFGAESLLVGGLRSFGQDGVSMTVTTDNLTLDNAGSELSGSDIILVAENKLTLGSGSRLVATGGSKVFDAISIGDSALSGSGDGTLVRVSGNASGTVSRLGVGTSTTAEMVVSDGAELRGGSIFLDSTYATRLSSSAKVNAGAVSLSSGQISIQLANPGLLNPTAGLVLSGEALASMQASTKRLALLSYSGIDVYGTGNVGSLAFEQLSLQAASIRGFNTGGGAATFSAAHLLIENAAGRPLSASPAGALQGTIRFDANRITLGGNNVRLDGFADVTLGAANGILVSGSGSFSAAGNVNLNTPLVTGASAANHKIVSDGILQLDRPATASGKAVAGGFGAALALVGRSVSVDSDIVLASGELTLHATSGDVLLGGTSAAMLDVGGTATRFVDVTRYTGGGTVNLLSDGGSVKIEDHGVISVSAKSGGGNAGRINVETPGGTFDLSGTIIAAAGEAGRKGEFSLDAGSVAGGSLAGLDEILNTGQFSQARNYRIRTGDVLVTGTALAHDYRVAADHGSITVTGTINASGVTGGNIQLQSTGSLILGSSSSLTVAGREFSNAGKGGTITLEAGAQRNGAIDTAALLDIRNGSALDLSVASNNSESATLGRFTGKLHLRAPRTAANDDVRIAPIAGDITGASSILVEGYKTYALTGEGVITAAVQAGIRNDATAFLGAAGTTTAGYTAMLNRLTSAQAGLGLILAPGAEIINPTGNLTLGTTTSTSTGDWNLETFRFGPAGAPGVLTLRAAGNLVFYNALSDGFAAVTPGTANGQSLLWLAPLMAQNPLLPVNTQSWSFRLTSGADLGSADSGAVLPESGLQADKGSLLLGKNYGNAATYGSGANFLTATAIANRYQVIRAGSGDITVNAARDVYLLNQFATIYTAGTQVADPARLFANGDFVVPLLISATGRQPTPGSVLGAAQQNYFAQYSMAGGDISIQAGRDIARMTRTVSTATGGVLIADSSRQLPVNWLYRRGFVDPVTGEFGAGGADDGGATLTDPSASTTWWVDYSNFFEGVGALGGGNVTLVAGHDVQNMDAVAPTNARMAGGKPDAAKMIELGGGDVTVLAGGDIDGGVYYVERGKGRLEAGGNITTNATRSPSSGIIGSLTKPVVFDSNTWLPTTLFVGKGGFDVQAAGDLLLGPVANPFLLPQGNGNKFWYKTYFSTYAADSYVNAISLGGDVTHRTGVSLPGETTSRPALAAWMFANNTLSTSQGAAGFQPWLRMAETTVDPFASLFGLMAPNLRSTALTGDIKLAGNLTLFPSPSGQVELLANGSIGGLQASGFITNLGVQRWITSTVNLSDADPASIPGITTPYAYQQVVGRAASALRATNTGKGAEFLGFLDDKLSETGSTSGTLEEEQALHTPGQLHLADRDPLRVYALGGDIDGLTLFSPKAARVLAGQDIGDIAFYFQNLTAADTSVVSAGRDLVLYNANTASRAGANASISSNSSVRLVPLAGDIQISGPGNLQVLAGRDLDLGLGGGNADGTGVGITSIGNGRNPYLAFNGANVTVGAGIGPASSLSGSSLDFAAFITDFVATADGQVYVDEIAPGVDFAAQDDEEQARLALEVFYLILRGTGRDFNDPESPGYGNYQAGLAAIKSLFGEGPWDGEILTQGRDIRTRSGGDIRILAPGGGLTLANTTIGNPLTPPGIVTESGGEISIFTDQSVNIGIGRIFTLRGGDVTIWSSKGDIAAGSSSRTIAAAPPTRVIIDPQSASVETDLAGLATGGGIGALATVEGVEPADIDLIAPTGSIDAGDAGIRVSGNINLAAVTVVNAGNISAGGSSSGTPSASVSAPSIGAVTSASNSSAAAGTAVANPAAGQAAKDQAPTGEALSIITVEVIGYGGSSEEDEEEKAP